jgi:hypothetical protein
MALKNTHKYDDIIDLPRPVCQRASRMTNYDRAAQFSPFAALTGFEAAIAETGRLTDSRIELDESEKAQLNAVLQEIQERHSQQPTIQATYFIYDEQKSGGAYITVQGKVKKIDVYSHSLLLTDGRIIPIREIVALYACR